MLNLVAIAQLALAAPVGAASVHPVEIIITGERIARPSQQSPSSLVTYTAADLAGAATPERIDQLLALTPNIQLGSGGEGPAIRGQDSTGALRDLPAFLGGTRSRLTVQVDGRAISYNELAFGVTPLWDVAQVEIYRSPQTSTQGRNAIAGAIFVTTGEPFTRWTAHGRVMADEASTRSFSAMVSGPLAGEQLRFRIAADIRRGLASTRITSAADASPRRDDSVSLRAKLLFAPAALPGTDIQLVAAHVTAAAPQINGASVPFRERRDPFATYGVFRTSVDSLTALIRSALRPSLHLQATLTAGRANIRRHAPPGFGEAHNRAGDRSADVSLDWRATPVLRLAFGGRLDRSTLDQQIDLHVTPVGLGDFGDRQRSIGIFGQADWTILPRLILSLGGRYQHDEQDRDGVLIGRLGTIRLEYRGRFGAVLPKASIAYQLTPAIRAGVLVQKAYNPGGTTIDLARAAAQTFDAETLWDYEMFIKATSRDAKVAISASLFSEQMIDAQRAIARRIVTPAGTVTFAEIVNQPRAFSRGIEAEVRWIVDDRLTLRGGVGLLRTRTTRTVSPTDPSLGREFARTPHWSASMGAEWQVTPTVRLSGQIRRNARYFSDDFETAGLRVGPATVADARADWKVGPVTVFGYARNLFDKFYLTWRFAPVPTRPNLATPGDPRQIGLGIDARF